MSMRFLRARFLPAFAVTAVASVAAAAPLRVELNGDNGRNDVRTRGWSDWRIPNGPAASGTFGDVRLTLRAVGDGSKVVADWWKRGFDFAATLASDGASLVPGAGAAALELVIEGLPAGRHTFASRHSAWSQEPAGAFDVAIDARDVASGVVPAHRVEHDDEVAVVFTEFEAAADKPVTVRFSPAAGGGPVRSLFLNGFAIDEADPRPQARRPEPADGDEHAAEAPLLRWHAPDSAAEFDVYLGTDAAALAAAAPGSAEHLGRTKGREMRAAASVPR